MTGDVRRARWTGAWFAIALGALTACNATPGAPAPMVTTRGALTATSVIDEVRQATDRSELQAGVVTLPSGERMRRITLPSGFNHVLVARMGSDGKPSISCVDNAPAAESFLAGAQQGNGR